jgi:hypothetical protein
MRNIIFKLGPILSTICLLSACALVPTQEEKMANFSNQCQSYGFKPQTDSYASCMMKLDADDQRFNAKASQCSAAAAAGPNYFAAYSLCMAATQ